MATAFCRYCDWQWSYHADHDLDEQDTVLDDALVLRGLLIAHIKMEHPGHGTAGEIIHAEIEEDDA